MNFSKNLTLLLIFLLVNSCVNTNLKKSKYNKTKSLYSSTGFALIYKEEHFMDGVVNKKISDDNIGVMHSFLKINTPIKIINPENSLLVESKVIANANYSNLFNIVISQKVANFLNLDKNNPYVEILEFKQNKKFIAKKSNIFDEEKNVMEKAPVDDIQINVLKDDTVLIKKKEKKIKTFTILISDFYYFKSANKLKLELVLKTKNKKFSVNKVKDNKYRLIAGPFKSFDALKSTYISLNNLGFDELNVYKE